METTPTRVFDGSWARGEGLEMRLGEERDHRNAPEPKKRLTLVQEIQAKLEESAVRPVLGGRLDYFAA